jgi:hypothetical protein
LPPDRVLNGWVIGLLAELSRPVNRSKMNQQPGCLILLRGAAQRLTISEY